ncbi:hypothetical protein [Paenibacillus glacialis]|uniref:Uncharacterized protein n=1 Tax=Paenibacillus glacialis TaxID=494026 RepID=A0A168NNN0_9BACL|nr:hypothetical protein [Paenibacillus glacialis]OAB45970.1 hypothetical protein PGLA_00815 [Paenibacillus glacialis]
MKKKKGRPYELQPSELEKFTSKYGDKNNKVRAWVFVKNSIKSGLIKEETEFAAYLLYGSCEARINAIRYKAQKPYIDVYIDWSDSNSMCRDIINHKPEFWKEWVVMTGKFIESKQKLSARPTVDRLSEDRSVGYRLENIAPLTHSANSSKALSKSCYVFQINFDLSGQKKFKRFQHKKEALKFIGINNKVDTGKIFEVDGKHYLIQSEAVTLGLEPMEEYNYEDDEEYTAWIPIGTIEDSNGETRIIKQEIRFPYMSVILTEQHKNT